MSTQNEFKTVIIDPVRVDRTPLYELLSRRNAYVIVSGEDATDLIPPPLATHLIYNGLVFWYDAADAVTAHDGVTTIVTFDGKRFKSDAYNGRGIRRYAVLYKDLTAPPGSPVLGAAYIVAAGGTGAWATKDKKIAVATARGWVFIQPNAYDEALAIDESLVYHYSSGGVWTAGVVGIILPAGGVNISSLKYGLGLRVFNQTTVAPPGSPAEGDAYIPFTGATGAWAGHAGKVAIFESGSWTILVPGQGWSVYDASVNRPFYYEGSAWVDPFSASAQWQLIEDRTTGAPAAQVDFTTGLVYSHIRATLIGVFPTSNAVLRCRVSEDGGATFKSGATDYIYGGGLAAFAQLTDNNMTANDIGCSGEAEFVNFGLAKKCSIRSVVNTFSTSAVSFDGRGNAAVLTAVRNALRFFFSAGNVGTGSRFIVEGRN